LIHKSSYKFDINARKDSIAASPVSMGIAGNAICAEILETLIYEGLLDTQDITDLVHSEVLLIEQYRDLSFQITRNRVWRHNNMYIQTNTNEDRTLDSHVHEPCQAEKTNAFPHTYEKRCKPARHGMVVFWKIKRL
jgi:hypothetical protein